MQSSSSHVGNYVENATTVSVSADAVNTVGEGVRQIDSTLSGRWAALSSTPVSCSNRFHALGSTTDDENGDPFTVVDRRGSKRQRNETASSQRHEQHQQQPAATRLINQPPRRNGPLLYGKASGSTSISAARIVRKKAVFYIDNVSSRCSVSDIQTLVKNMKVNVISCFEVKPRRYRTLDSVNSKAFRLCINDEDKQRVLDASMWPDSVVVSEWFYKQPSAEQRRQRRTGIPTGGQSSAADAIPDAHLAAGAAADTPANNTTSDDTILAACNMDMDTATSRDDGE